MKLMSSIVISFAMAFTCSAQAESLRCHGDIIEVGDAKIDVYRQCGEPVVKDTYCEKIPIRIRLADGSYNLVEHCENIDVWTYNPGKGQFWTNLYFSQGKLREIKYGDRVQ